MTVMSDLGLGLAVFDRAHAVADVQADVPQETHVAGDALVLFVEGLCARHDRDVDIGAGVQLAAPVAAHRQQGETPRIESRLAPRRQEDLIDQPRALGDQRVDPNPHVEPLLQVLAPERECLAVGRDRGGSPPDLALQTPRVEERRVGRGQVHHSKGCHGFRYAHRVAASRPRNPRR